MKKSSRSRFVVVNRRCYSTGRQQLREGQGRLQLRLGGFCYDSARLSVRTDIDESRNKKQAPAEEGIIILEGFKV